MKDFEFYNPVRILFGKGKISELPNLIDKNKRILITFGGGSIKKFGVYDQVITSLEGYNIKEFGGIEPNPTFETCMKVVEFIKNNNIDFILAVGGGSVIDATKFISAAVNFEGDPWDILTKQAEVKTALPFGTVLTIPATGSEMNCGSVISRSDSPDKLAFMSEFVFPKFSILDPKITYTLPTNQTANGIIDAFVHVMEQYLTYSVNSPIQDRMAEGILLTLIEESPKVMKNPNDYETRANLKWAATVALNYWINVGVPQDWATHRIGHELTAKFGLDHGVTLAIILPSLMYVKQDKKRAKILQYADRVWNITSGSDDEKIKLVIEKTRDFFESLNVKTRLFDYGITENEIPDILSQLEKHGLTALGEHQDIDLETSKLILEKSL